MVESDGVRDSRDGDQFHYHWAARESLKLLRPDSELAAIAVEGVSDRDTYKRHGEQVIDLAEYYGSENLHDASQVLYRQLKHSTRQADQEWTASGFKKTLTGFSAKFRHIRKDLPEVESKVTFEFVTNRPVGKAVLQALDELASDCETLVDSRELKYLRAYAGFHHDRDAEISFFGKFRVIADVPGLMELESFIRFEVAGLLPGSTIVQHVMLKEMVSRRATSLEKDHMVRRATVLAALAVTESELLPAYNLIRRPEQIVDSRQVHEVAAVVIAAADQPVIVHAEGGIGKSVLTTQLADHLPGGSLAVVYDCFGDGSYRRSSQPRHQHQQGLVQLSNELASHVLCDPLIPVETAQPHHYMRAFLVRLEAAAQELRTRQADALLTIVVDAGDNAVMAAEERGSTPTFAADLLREQLPKGVRLMMTCRTERVHLLNPPPNVRSIALAGFGVEESALHLRGIFPEATDAQAAEFHRRTGGNPRIQAFVLEDSDTLVRCLASLGEARGVDGRILDDLLRRRVAEFKDQDAGAAAGIDRVCEALAALRPRIPVRVLTALCAVPAALIRSFVAQLGRPLLIDGDTVQFRDEPTETWFRTYHRPIGPALITFIDKLMPLADVDAYVAASLPELLWQAERVDVLVDLAMRDQALPKANDLEQREIAQQRVQYALKATLRSGREADAARLALKAGTLAAGHTRTLRLLRRNTDLAGRFLDAQTVEDLVATRSLAGSWPGSSLHREAALLSCAAGQRELASSRLRSAVEWMRAWIRQPHDRGHGVKDHDLAEVALGLLNTEGVDACNEFLASWRPHSVVFTAGYIVANRLADVGRTDELDLLAVSPLASEHLLFAVACAAWRTDHVCSIAAAHRLVAMLRKQRHQLSFDRQRPWPDEYLEVQAVVWIAAMGLRHKLISDGLAGKILARLLPANLGRSAGALHGTRVEPLLCGFALLARVRGHRFDVSEFAHEEIAQAAEQSAHDRPRSWQEYQRDIIPLAGWADLRVSCLLGINDDPSTRFNELTSATLKPYSDYETPRVLINGIARLGGPIIVHGVEEAATQRFLDWCVAHHRYLTTSSVTDLVRATATTPATQHIAVAMAQRRRDAVDASHDEADEKAKDIVSLARAVYRFDPQEAAAYFAHARDLTDRVGDDARARWTALVAFTTAASTPDRQDHERAYRVAQVVEGLGPYLGDGIDHTEALTAISQLSPIAAVSIASRWRDRQFCPEWPFVEAAFANGSLLAPNLKVPLALLPFRSSARLADQLEVALRENPESAERISAAVGEFLSHSGISADVTARFTQVADDLGIDVSQTPFGAAGGTAAGRRSRGYRSSTDWDRPTEADPDKEARRSQALRALEACDLTSVQGWEASRSIISSNGRRRNAAVGFEDLADRLTTLPLADLSAALGAFVANPHFTASDYDTVLDRLDTISVLPQAAIHQIGQMAREATARFCRKLTLSLYYHEIDLDRLARLSGTDDDLTASALRYLGSHPTALQVEECFTLAVLLARRLSPEHAQRALDDMTRLSEQVAPLDSADGIFTALPTPPPQLSDAVAGYIWAALGDPDIRTRWNAAHSVRLLIGMGCAAELHALNLFATSRQSCGAFTAQRFEFYDRHALLWLLIALARAARDQPPYDELTTFVPLLRKTLFDDPPHVVAHAFAKDAISALVSAGALTLNPEERDALARINTPVGRVRRSWSERYLNRKDDGAEDDHDKANLFSDFNEYWCAPLGDAFGLTASQVERAATDVITRIWCSHSTSGGRDPRSAAEAYGGRSTYVYKGDWPEADDPDFYHAVHALCILAGELLKSRPVCVYGEDDDDGDDENPFGDWIGRFLLGRADHRWIADRRDPAPDSVFAEDDQSTGPEWVWRLASSHFADRLLTDDGWVTVWEYSDDANYEAKQRTWVRSALVVPERARSLAIALQTAPSSTRFHIPAAGDNYYECDTDGFLLTGWIDDPYQCVGIDSRDPWAKSVRHPPPRPSRDMVEAFGLKPGPDLRVWTRQNAIALRSRVWDETHEINRGRPVGFHGEQLQIRQEVLRELLRTTQRSLIVQVSFERTHEQLKQSRIPARRPQDDNVLPVLERSYKIFVLDESGGCGEL